MEAGDFDRLLDEAEATIIRIVHTSADVLSDTDGLILETERLLRDIGFMVDILPLVEGEILLQSIADIYTSLENKKISEDRRNSIRGRPCINVSEEQLSLLLSFHFTVSDIASMLQVSTSTVK